MVLLARPKMHVLCFSKAPDATLKTSTKPIQIFDLCLQQSFWMHRRCKTFGAFNSEGFALFVHSEGSYKYKSWSCLLLNAPTVLHLRCIQKLLTSTNLRFVRRFVLATTKLTKQTLRCCSFLQIEDLYLQTQIFDLYRLCISFVHLLLRFARTRALKDLFALLCLC